MDKICGRYGLDTGGEVNCSVGKDVVVNLRRWLLATPVYAHDVAAYRALIINHEVGHFLGHNHVTCPDAGKPAPVMMQQIKGMHGCAPNVWPYDREDLPCPDRPPSPATEALREVFLELLVDEQPLRRLGALIAGADIRHPLPLVRHALKTAVP
ncbi:DUF3152 domain-containing protein [Streptomyces mirabilis]|uniref:DUF3152 domain-containing protein n=1 Tax=Streptomyces mirabilis TaxID=68239 RepID=UPI0036E49B01